MSLPLLNRRALVTGAGRGIGRAISHKLAQLGAQVAMTSRTESDLASLFKEVDGKAKGHFYLAQNVLEEGAPTELANKVKEHFGNIDILINNVGDTLSITDPLCSINDWRKVMRLNLEIAVELNNEFIPAMKERKWGRIINTCSTASFENNGPVPYCTAKAAFAAYTHSMGRVLAPTGIVMSGLIVGAVLTEGGHWDKAKIERPEHVEKYLSERCPMGDFGKPEDIAHLVGFLSSEEACFFHGALIPIDGGQSRHFFNQVCNY